MSPKKHAERMRRHLLLLEYYKSHPDVYKQYTFKRSPWKGGIQSLTLDEMKYELRIMREQISLQEERVRGLSLSSYLSFLKRGEGEQRDRNIRFMRLAMKDRYSTQYGGGRRKKPKRKRYVKK